MKKGILGFGLILTAIAAFVAYNALFTVYQTQQALVLQFGDPKRVINEPGLQLKLPFVQNVIYIDKRILDLDSPAQEVIASDQKRLVVDAFARYQISDPLVYFRSVGTQAIANQRLAVVLNSAVRRVLGDATFEAVVRDQRQTLMERITAQVNRE
ncbi:MAG: SPFH domain-containing protein, partial [Pseudomonadota bacterium]